MTFQAYIDNIKSKTGKAPEDFKKLMDKAGVYKSDMTATQLCDWLSKEFDIGRGHAMAIWAVFKSKGWVGAPKAKKPKP
jgi:hypothetical protein